MPRFVITLFLVVVCVCIAHAQQRDYYFTIGYSKAHSMGMGGAFFAMEGGLSSIHYNPATFRLANISRGFRITGFINPVASLSLYSHYRNDSEKGISGSNWWDIAKVLPKAIIFSTPNWEFALLGQEELESRKLYHDNKKLFEAEGFLNHIVNTALLRVRLADQVHIGGTISHYTSRLNSEIKSNIGSSYGIYILPSRRFAAGIVFANLPGEFNNIRLENDRIEDESVNIGVSYHLFNGNSISLDVRNISEENKVTTRELHFGIEQGLWRHLYIRTGFYREQKEKTNHYSFGAGLLNLNSSKNGVKKFLIPVFAINYALRLNRSGGQTTRTHFLSINWGY